MGIFDTNIIEKPLTLSAYTILPCADEKALFGDFYYENIFKEDVLMKDGDWMGMKGVIEHIGNIPLECLSEFKRGNKRLLLNLLKSYVKSGIRVYVVYESYKFKFKFLIPKTYYACVINVYTR